MKACGHRPGQPASRSSRTPPPRTPTRPRRPPPKASSSSRDDDPAASPARSATRFGWLGDLGWLTAPMPPPTCVCGMARDPARSRWTEARRSRCAHGKPDRASRWPRQASSQQACDPAAACLRCLWPGPSGGMGLRLVHAEAQSLCRHARLYFFPACFPPTSISGSLAAAGHVPYGCDLCATITCLSACPLRCHVTTAWPRPATCRRWLGGTALRCCCCCCCIMRGIYDNNKELSSTPWLPPKRLRC
jgi:hypothetical protein